jgi:hypothetical protein
MMREFEHPNMTNGFICPICKTSKDFPVVLVGIPGTEEDGIIECSQVHSKCYQLVAEMNNIKVDIEPWNK